jgi:hypothetical protein
MKFGIEVNGEWMGTLGPGGKAVGKRKATHTGKPGGRFDPTLCPLINLETFPSNTGLLSDAQLFNDPLVSVRVAPLQIL